MRAHVAKANGVDRRSKLRYLHGMGIDVYFLQRDSSMPSSSQLKITPKQSNDAAVDRDKWKKLLANIRTCEKCALANGRTNAVPGAGNTAAQWMLIGEGPGKEEDLRGLPFVGRAGKLLDKMLKAIKLDRETVYITNMVKCRPPQNRNPRPEELGACLAYIEEQVQLVQPRLVLALGAVAANSLLGTTAPLSELRLQIHEFKGFPLIVTYHPAYLLRSPGMKKQAWEDLKFACRTLGHIF